LLLMSPRRSTRLRSREEVGRERFGFCNSSPVEGRFAKGAGAQPYLPS
jgi:hypothetical protein